MVKYKRKDENIASKIHDEIVMVNIDQGNYFGLNTVGSDIWEILNEFKSIDQIVELLMESYEIDRETCMSEVKSFIDRLTENDLVETS